VLTVSCSIGHASDYRYLLALLTDVDTGLIDTIHPGMDPGLPTYTEAMVGPDRELYEEAMTLEVTKLEDHGTWVVIPKSSVPIGAKILPSTWVLRTKRYPDGRLRKHKASICVRGDRQVEGIDYTEKYSPVV
jgi:hypothetical protein